MQFDRNTDRSVLGSLRTADIDLSWQIHDAHVLDCDPLAVSLELNERPTSVKGKWLHPSKVMLERVKQLADRMMKFNSPLAQLVEQMAVNHSAI